MATTPQLLLALLLFLQQLALAFHQTHNRLGLLDQLSCVDAATATSSFSRSSVLTMPFDEISDLLRGSGKAKIFWKNVREAVDPLSTPDGPSSEVPLEVSEFNHLSAKAKEALRAHGLPLFGTHVALETASDCGTRKLLQTLHDGQSIESVLIPSAKFDRTTLCVSTQVGCDRGCAFCLTGQMGLARSLSAAEIVAQVFRGLQAAKQHGLPEMTNVVFMGMGDAGRNIEQVRLAVECMVDRQRLAMAAGKITVSTVGPSPEVFMQIAAIPCVIAWSLHSPVDAIRRRLVPSTRHTTAELRDGLLRALQSRPLARSRTIMLALTLIDGINDSAEDARELVAFVQPMLAVAPKIAIDLIPYNDIAVPGFVRPSRERVAAFQRVLREHGLFCSVRVARGDEESSACGMLATERIRKGVAV